jgi:hypothetical protein
VASVQGHGDQALSLTKNFVLPETASRLQEELATFQQNVTDLDK